MPFYADVAVIENRYGKRKEMPLEEYRREKTIRGVQEGWKLVEEIRSEDPMLDMSDTDHLVDEELYEMVKNYGISPPAADRATRILLLRLIKEHREKQLGKKVMQEALDKRQELKYLEDKEERILKREIEDTMTWAEAKKKAWQIANAKDIAKPEKQDIKTLLKYINENK